MNKSNQKRPRDAEGRFESKNESQGRGKMGGKSKSHGQNTPVRDGHGRFESKNSK